MHHLKKHWHVGAALLVGAAIGIALEVYSGIGHKLAAKVSGTGGA